jgi:hypothetical protein
MNTGILVLPLESVVSKWSNESFISNPSTYSILYDKSHAYAYIPNGKKDSDKINLSVIIDNINLLFE